MKLVIVESPNKCETIARYLGPGYKVLASKGHVRDLSMRGKGGLGIDVDKDFEADWVISPRKKEVIEELRAALRRAEDVYLATDPDREGEAISWHLAQVLNLPIKTTKRLTFHEITEPAIKAAVAKPGIIDMNLVDSQAVRRMEDRIIGFRISSLIRKNYGLEAAGRVQSSTLRMIVDRQKTIDDFVPDEYWTIEIELEVDGKLLKAPLIRVDGKPFKCKSKEEADAILARMPKELRISSISKTKKTILPKPAFSTSTLQQEAYAKYHFSNSHTQSLAQKLFEGLTVNGEHVGLITYHRTEDTALSTRFFEKHAKPYILETYGPAFVGTLRSGKKTKEALNAHEGIRPTGTHRTPDVVAKFVTPDAAKLYRLIYCRALASVMAPKLIEHTSIILSGNGLDFSLGGSRVIFPGYSAIFGEFDEKEEETLPLMQEDQVYPLKKVIPEQKFTKPEPQYNQATIVRAMEEKGIGRPSTYATTLETLKGHKYVHEERGVLSPTELGIKLVHVLQELFPDIVSTDYTAAMERKLDSVESGEKDWLDAMNDFYEPFTQSFEHAKEEIGVGVVKGECPICHRPLIERHNRQGQPFIGCSGWPACKYIQREERPQDELVHEDCPECGKPLVYKVNKKGERFIGCSGFPACRYTRNLHPVVVKPRPKVSRPPVTEADYVKPCPRCKTGFMIVRHGKKADFLGCTNWPKCKHIEFLNDKKK